MSRAVGLDVGARHVRLVEAEGGSRGLRVTRLGERDIVVPEGGDREDAVREAVEALFRETHAARDQVVLLWPAESCVLREISVPFREPDQIRKVVKFEFESHLHREAIEDVVLDFLPVGETRDGARLLCIAAPKAPLRARLEALGKARIDPVAVDSDLASLAGAAAVAGVLEETPTCVLVDVGAVNTKIVVVADGKLRGGRAFRSGAEALAAGPPPQAAAPPAPDAAGDAPTTAIAVSGDRRLQVLDRIAREVSRTVAGAPEPGAFSRVWLAGRGALVPGVPEDLAARLGMEVRALDLLGRMQHPVPPDGVPEASAAYAAAIGAAARGLGAGPAQLDLRREDLSYARRFDRVKGGIAAGLLLLLLAVGFLLWRAKNEKEVAQAEFNAMVATLRRTSDAVEADYRKELGEEQAKKLFAGSGDPLTTVPDARRRVKQMYDHLRNEMGLSTEVPPIGSCLEVFLSVNQAVKGTREAVDYCLLAKENYNQKEVQFDVVLAAREQADVLKKALQEARGKDGKPIFPPNSVQYGAISENRQGKYSVTFTGKFERK